MCDVSLYPGPKSGPRGPNIKGFSVGPDWAVGVRLLAGFVKVLSNGRGEEENWHLPPW